MTRLSKTRSTTQRLRTLSAKHHYFRPMPLTSLLSRVLLEQPPFAAAIVRTLKAFELVDKNRVRNQIMRREGTLHRVMWRRIGNIWLERLPAAFESKCFACINQNFYSISILVYIILDCQSTRSFRTKSIKLVP